jgi:mono/diheme cytochrome c family protein
MRESLYRAFTDPAALGVWLSPGEMARKVHEFDLQVGGGYRMSLFYPSSGHAYRGDLGAGRPFHSTVRNLFGKNSAQHDGPVSVPKKLQNPFAMSPENLRAGMEHFADHCAICHANDGSGDTLFGKNLYPKPPDMRSAETQSKPDGELYYTIQNGVRLTGMPAFGEDQGTADADTWKLVLSSASCRNSRTTS